MEIKPQVHFMLDLETLDTKPSAHILELALICFCPYTGRVNEALSRHVRFGLFPQERATISPSTLSWWSNENQQYFMNLINNTDADNVFLKDVLFEIVELFNDVREHSELRIWNTGTFDVDIVNDAVKRVFYEVKNVINFWEVRDVRSLRQVAEDFGLNNDEWPTSHNAKDDCLRQISYVHSVYGALSERRTTSVGNSGGHSNVPTAEEQPTDESARQQTGITGK
mgnify:CR=1 FL=1